jgi:hypothetical protein
VHRGGNIREVKENNLSKYKKEEVTKLYMTFHKAKGKIFAVHTNSGPEVSRNSGSQISRKWAHEVSKCQP